MNFKDKVIIVTGGGQGIGRGVALHLAKEGAVVVLAEIDREAGEEAETLLSRTGTAVFIQTDTADEGSVASMVNETLQRFGGIDGLVNNAGIASPENSPLERLSLFDWNRVLATNLTGYFLCAKHAAAHLRRRHGAIVNISSTRSLQSEANTEAYSASKGGVDALTHAMAISLGPDVRVNAVLPGWIVVDEWKKDSARRDATLSREDNEQHPAGRAGKPEDIASLVAYLLSDAASFVTGQRFVVDGGMTRKMIYHD